MNFRILVNYLRFCDVIIYGNYVSPLKADKNFKLIIIITHDMKSNNFVFITHSSDFIAF